MEASRVGWFLLGLLGLAMADPPHIIVIMADDLGWYDVGFHGSDQIPTPNIDGLAYNGIILNSHYVQPLCTPSRAAFLTGKYPIRLGMQSSVILEPEPRGLPLDEVLLSQHLKSAGYSTHAVGKWHLGFFRSEYTPTQRGFDTHFGYWNGFQDYFNHSVKATFEPSMIGYDMRRNMEVDYASRGNYSTHLFTDEAVKLIREHDVSTPMFLYMAHLAPHTGNIGNAFQAPDEDVARFAHINDPERRVYAAMVSVLDRSVGDVIAALRQKDMLDNSIILFLSDNGAPSYGIHSNRGSNYPLRGQKNTPWEGSSRGVAAIWSPLLKNHKSVYDQTVHITDWLPTFWSAIGRDPDELGDIDGVDVWEALSNGSPSPRSEFLLNMDPTRPYAAVRSGKWKYIEGNSSYSITYNDWYGGYGHGTSGYNPSDILMSKASAALLGYITDRQIMSRNFSMSPLNVEDVELLRSKATLKCDRSNVANSTCSLTVAPCLFDISEDPCEARNVIAQHPDVAKALQELVAGYALVSLPPANLPADPDADPRLHGGVWSSWADEERVSAAFRGWTPASRLAFKVLCLVAGGAMLLLICAQIKRQLEWRDEAKKYSYDRSRDFIVNPSVSVAKRIEMFEESGQKLRS